MNVNNPINFSSIPASINLILPEEATIQAAGEIHSLTATTFSSVIASVHQEVRSIYARGIGIVRENPTASALIMFLSGVFIALCIKYRKSNARAETKDNQIIKIQSQMIDFARNQMIDSLIDKNTKLLKNEDELKEKLSTIAVKLINATNAINELFSDVKKINDKNITTLIEQNRKLSEDLKETKETLLKKIDDIKNTPNNISKTTTTNT
jgi:hypothetical protein